MTKKNVEQDFRLVMMVRGTGNIGRWLGERAVRICAQ